MNTGFFFFYTFYNWLFVVFLSALTFCTCFISSDVILYSAVYVGLHVACQQSA